MRKLDGEIVEKWVKIMYDYMPKYCKTCIIQGHDEQQYYVKHSELHPGNAKQSQIEGEEGTDKKKGEKIEIQQGKQENKESNKGKNLMGRNINSQREEDTGINEEFQENRQNKGGNG